MSAGRERERKKERAFLLDATGDFPETDARTDDFIVGMGSRRR